ncbi:MAG TPA: bifunctional serine/threonine-protein kinase/ABC transporter substrate-binding protein, partial [Polyangia bacterium]|nr:bifunctional serine/threonine-protein kinase/ABC transporter substrate-binding protein [Polyangia bacterium]
MLVQKLAEGGMAEIFLAKQTGIEGFERNVVVKRMLPHLSRQPHFVDMFLDEARLAARLVHANIIPIYEVGQIDDSYYICMEYLPGEDLAWVLKQSSARHAQLPIDVAVRIVVAAARGLHHAHELCDEEGKPLHIVHRDVSPSNLYLSFEGQVKVLDFGIAKAESRVTTTSSGTIKGKSMYMAPEQSRAEPVDRRSDIYALGVTLYEALTVSRPFLRDSIAGQLSAVLHGDFEPPRQRRPELSEELERIVLKAMALDARDRYATAAELADDLERTLGSAPVSPTGEAEPIGRFLRELCGEGLVAVKTRIPTLASLQKAAASEPAVKGPPTQPTLPIQPTSMMVPQATPRPPRWRIPLIAAGAVAAFAIGAWAGLRPAPILPDGCRAHYGSDASDAIVIGATLPLTFAGQPEDGQLQLLNAMRLALDEINQRDGVGGRSFALRVCDNAGDSARVRNQVRWLVEDVKVPALVTSWSSMTLLAVHQTLAAGVLTVTADATSPELSALPATNAEGLRMLWRTSPSDAMQGRKVAELVATDRRYANVERVAILYQDDPYGQGLAGVIAARLPQLKPTLQVRTIQYPFRGDVSSAVSQLAAGKPQLTVLVGFPLDVVRILNLAAATPALTRKAGMRWFFSDSVQEPTLFAGLERPGEIDGTFGLEPATGDSAESVSFYSRFQSRFLRRAQSQTYAANRYDAVYLIALAAAYAVGKDGHGTIDGARL